MNTSQSKGYSPTAKFLSVSDKEMKELIDYVLDQRKIRSNQIAMAGQIIEAAVDTVTFGIIKEILSYLDEKETLHEQFFERKIDRANTKLAINEIKSEILPIKTRIERMKNTNISFDERKIEVPVAFNSCQKILNEFENQDHSFYMHPLVSSPLLIAFSQLYTSVCTYGVELLPTYAELAESEKKRLKEVVEAYKVNTINERLKMVKVVEKIKVPYFDGNIKDSFSNLVKIESFKNIFDNLKNDAKKLNLHEVDIVKDGFGFNSKHSELHYWDRTFWGQKQNSEHNYEYPIVVRTAYEHYFDEVIDTIF
ncbi:hypothetical protein C1645_786158 [Glomus cerebriforme]|uniref:Uncharacterized protein n=1 Tax=Glomus cerebriforme TaxID=658196 RepID=A0A397SLR1_9GLOM|nr:hypothetical protein C1645_786158 [Glomus cerebriforme]